MSLITGIPDKSETNSAPERSEDNAKLTQWSKLRLIAGGSQVNRVTNADTAARRARWLAELGEALDQARTVTKQLGAAEGRIEMVELFARIEAVRLEVHAMRIRRRAARPDFDPEWTNLPWQRSA